MEKNFREKVYIPLDKAENVLRITDLMIKDFEELFLTLDETQRAKIL